MVTGETLLAAGADFWALVEPKAIPLPELINEVGAVLSASARVDEDDAEDDVDVGPGLAVVEIASADIFRMNPSGWPDRVRGSDAEAGRGWDPNIQTCLVPARSAPYLGVATPPRTQPGGIPTMRDNERGEVASSAWTMASMSCWEPSEIMIFSGLRSYRGHRCQSGRNLSRQLTV